MPAAMEPIRSAPNLAAILLMKTGESISNVPIRKVCSLRIELVSPDEIRAPLNELDFP